MDAVTMGLVCPARELERETKSNAASSSCFCPSSGGSSGSIQLGLVTGVSIAGYLPNSSINKQMHLCKINQYAVPDEMPVGGEQHEVYIGARTAARNLRQ